MALRRAIRCEETRELGSAAAGAHRRRASRRSDQRPADDAGDVPDSCVVLHAQDRPRGVHPQRRRRRGQKLLVSRPGDPPAVPGSGLRGVCQPREPDSARAVGDAVLRVAPGALPDCAWRGPAHRHRVLPVGGHLQPDGHRAVLGLCRGHLHAGAGQTAVPADWRRRQPGRVGRLGACRTTDGGVRAAPADRRRCGRPRRLRVSQPTDQPCHRAGRRRSVVPRLSSRSRWAPRTGSR